MPAAAHTVGVNLSDPAGGAAGNGTYTLMTFPAGTYTGSNDASQFYTASSPTPNSLNGATIAYHLADASNTVQDGTPANATQLIMQVTGGPNALTWTGGVDGTWDTGTPGSPFNFKNVGTGSGSTFAGNDNVTFDDTGANTNPITVAAGGVQPNIITINNTNTTYAFTGSGDIKGSSVGGTGGMYLTGTGGVTIANNYTAAGPITIGKGATGTVSLNGNITSATSLTVNSGAVTLGGANTFSGNTVVNGGSLTVSGASATFGKGNLTVSGGSAVISAGVTDAILNSATLTLAGGGTANTADVGFINLATGINEQVASLILGTTAYTSGTFGSTASGATNTFDEYFSGVGIITVMSSLLGDYNHDGTVNAADYVAWRMGQSPNPNSLADYNTWRANFGTSAGSGSGLGKSAAVPEPGALALVILALGSAFLTSRKTSR